jgi:hypothetical protein
MGVQDVNRVAPFEPSKAFKKLSTIGVTFGWDRWVVSAAMSLRRLESGIVSPAVGFLLGAGLAASK